jgi:hypothetical protein
MRNGGRLTYDRILRTILLTPHTTPALSYHRAAVVDKLSQPCYTLTISPDACNSPAGVFSNYYPVDDQFCIGAGSGLAQPVPGDVDTILADLCGTVLREGRWHQAS